jgi:hypothetical protein
MARKPVFIIAALISTPGVLLALAGALYIAWSIATEAWYRATFLDYGLTLLTYYVALLVGVAAEVALAAGIVRTRPTMLRFAAWFFCAAGVLAAVALEVQFWNESDRPLPRGVFLLPFVAWAIVAALRPRPTPPVPR